MIDISTIRQVLSKQRADYDLANAQVKEERKALREVRERLEDIQAAQKLVQEVAQSVQEQAHRQIGDIVTRCLSAVYEERAPEFRITFEQKRGKTEARLLFVQDGQEMDPLKEGAGGMVDVAAFALRLACLILARPRKRRLLVLDEPFRFVDVGVRPRLRDLLLALAEELGVQIVMVTHSPELVVGKVIHLE